MKQPTANQPDGTRKGDTVHTMRIAKDLEEAVDEVIKSTDSDFSKLVRTSLREKIAREHPETFQRHLSGSFVNITP
jgi:hypothetical protein